MYAMPFYIAELYPILLHYRSIPCLFTVQSFFAKICRPPISSEYYVTQKPRELSTKPRVDSLQPTSDYRNPHFSQEISGAIVQRNTLF